jgi:hypothetical protein
MEFFLPIKNHARASTISRRNLRLTETSVCIVRESGSLVLPLKKIVRVIAEITEKMNERMIISLKGRFNSQNDMIRKPEPSRRILRNISNKTSLRICLIRKVTL